MGSLCESIIIFTCVFSGFFLGTIIISNVYSTKPFLWTENYENDDKSDEDEDDGYDEDDEDDGDDEDNLKWDTRFIKEIKQLPTREMSEKDLLELKQCVLTYNIKTSTIVMFYDHTIQMFCYYTNNSIPYKKLDATARKYVLTYDCKQIYQGIDENDLIIEDTDTSDTSDNSLDDEASSTDLDTINEKEPKEKEPKEKEPNKSGGIFAVFKNYKTQNLTTGEHKDDILIEKPMNKFICRGNLIDYDEIKTITNEPPQEKKDISYTDYKKTV